MFSKIFTRLNILRFVLALASITIILVVLPRADHKEFTYEQNQPWKYPLLTAEFDIPVLRDSASMRIMRDSIDRSFVPFVQRDNNSEALAIQRFERMAKEKATPEQISAISDIILSTYKTGIVDEEIIEQISKNHISTLRLVNSGDSPSNELVQIDATKLFTPREANIYIDSLVLSHDIGHEALQNHEIIKAINLSITPNIVLDTVLDNKFREQEYLTVNGALGVIKTGQRIIDRGEIITPQLFTILNTYQEMLETRQSDNNNQTYFMIGQGIYIAIILLTLYIFLAIYRPRFFSDIRKMTFLITFITLFTIFAVLMFEHVVLGIYIVPFAAVPVMVIVFFDSRTAIFSLIATVFLAALVATYPLMFLFMELIVGLVATFSIYQLDRRSQLLRTAVLSLLTYVVTYLVMLLIMEGTLEQFSWRLLIMFVINSVILSFAYVLILVIEKLFGFTSAVTLVELSDINSPLLRRLAEEAPGTFQHSIQVSTIAAEAARAIGANTTLVRTGALYHDIGKLASPIFYTENQHGVNPHAGLDPVTSARKIVSHVAEGANLANKHKLPPLIKTFIMEHHGKGMAKFFYNTAVNQNPDKVIDRKDFSYPGPNPQTVETSILMMADAVEAASRSLQDYSPQSIDRLVENIINGQIADGMFKESPISFHDVEVIKDVFKKRLATIYHTRVRYPDMKQDTATAQTLNKIDNA